MVVTLVDDDPTVLELLAELLRVHGHDPRPVLITMDDTIATGLDRLARVGAAVVLMDLGMPVPGLDLLAAAREDARLRSMRFVVASASFDAPRGERPVVPDGVK